MRRAVLLAVMLAACSDDPGRPGAQVTPVPNADRAALITQVGRLAHDSMRGRGSTTIDERRAAQYIEQQFSAFGLDGATLAQFIVRPPDTTSQNVIGVLPGRGALQDEWIVLGAHYDHVGVQPALSGNLEIFNGADDNASGTALLLELARLLAGHVRNGGFGDEARRSVMFIAFGAEELGLIGSERFCAQPTIAMQNIIAMLNFDMVGRLNNRELGVGGRQTALEWSQLLITSNSDQLILRDNDCQACTDHACFRRAGRPVLWFFTGFHPQYHQPGDDVGLINQEGLGQVTDLAARMVADLMLRESKLSPAPLN